MGTTGNTTATAQAGAARTMVTTQGVIYDGVVRRYDYETEKYEVELSGSSVLTCTYLSPIFSRMLGLNTKFILPPGTYVKVVTGDRPCIIGALPSTESILATGAQNRITITGDPQRELTGELPKDSLSPDIPVDLLEGELDLTNAMRVGIQLLLGFARLTAGERALVETHAFNDMVRIVSEVFRHHSAFGDEEIYSDGTLNKVEHGTSYDHEAWGLEEASDEKAENPDNDLPGDPTQDTGKWRYSRYMGFLGDFIHLFVTDPPSVVEGLVDGALRAGKARVQIMSDGTLLAQTTSEVCIERTCRVSVPVENSRWDAEGVSSSLNGQYAALWSALKASRDRQDLTDMAYQLREYARWLNTYHSFSKIMEQSNWEVKKETEQPAPSWGNKEPSVERANQSEEALFYDTYACFRIMRDGSIVLFSGDGSSIVMAGGSMQIHASRNLDLRAAGDINMHAGRDIHMHARRHLDLAAFFGGLKVFTRNYVEALCSKGSIWMRSDAPDPNEEGYEPEAGTADNPAAVVWEHAIHLDAREGKILVDGYGDTQMHSGAGDAVLSSKAHNVHLRAKRGLVEIVGRSVRTHAVDIWTFSRRFLNNVSGYFALFSGNSRYMTVNSSGLTTTNLWADSVDASGVLNGPAVEENIRTALVQAHVGASPRSGGEEVADPVPPDADIDDVRVWGAGVRNFEEELFQAGGPPLFVYTPGEYDLRDRNRETLTEQFLRMDLPADWDEDYDVWTPGSLSGQIPGGRSPFSDELTYFRHDPRPSLRKLTAPSSEDPKQIPQEPTGWGPFSVVWRYLKSKNPNP